VPIPIKSVFLRIVARMEWPYFYREGNVKAAPIRILSCY